MSIYMSYPEGKTKALTLSYDDGVYQDTDLVNLMVKYGIKGTFNINSGMFSPDDFEHPTHTRTWRMSAKMCYDLYEKNGMEAAVHGLTHPFLETLPDSVCLWEILKDRQNLEELFGRPVHGMAYPYGTYNDNVVRQVQNAGIYYARTTISHNSFVQPGDWLRLGATAHHKSPKLKELTERFITEEPVRDPYLFYLWGHSFEFDRENNWNIIEEFFEKVSGKEDVWYATNIEVYQYTQGFKRLDFSVSGKWVYNPSALTVWFKKDNSIIEVKSGETVRI